jgi:hypothetical protein
VGRGEKRPEERRENVEGEKLCIKLKSSFGKWQLRSIRNTA